jgi:hypothetical protein
MPTKPIPYTTTAIGNNLLLAPADPTAGGVLYTFPVDEFYKKGRRGRSVEATVQESDTQFTVQLSDGSTTTIALPPGTAGQTGAQGVSLVSLQNDPTNPHAFTQTWSDGQVETVRQDPGPPGPGVDTVSAHGNALVVAGPAPVPTVAVHFPQWGAEDLGATGGTFTPMLGVSRVETTTSGTEYTLPPGTVDGFEKVLFSRNISGVLRGVTPTVNVIALSPLQELYVGGTLTQAGPHVVNNIAKWDGVQWLPVGPGVTGGDVTTITFDAKTLQPIIAGSFTHCGGPGGNPVECPSKVARFNGSYWDPVGGPTAPGMAAGEIVTCSAVHRYTGHLFVGGTFTSMCGVATPSCIARWDGTQWTNVGDPAAGATDNRVYDLQVVEIQPRVKDGPYYLYACGQFTTVAGVAAPGKVARYVSATNVWESLASAPTATNNPVFSLQVDPRSLDVYVCGQFTSINGLACATRVAKWTHAASSWSMLGAGTSASTVRKVLFSPDFSKLYASTQNRVTFAGTYNENGVAYWNFAASQWIAVGSGEVNERGGTISTLAVSADGQQLYAGGSISQMDLARMHRIAVWNGAKWNGLGVNVAFITVNGQFRDTNTGAVTTQTKIPSGGILKVVWDAQDTCWNLVHVFNPVIEHAKSKTPPLLLTLKRNPNNNPIPPEWTVEFTVSVTNTTAQAYTQGLWIRLFLPPEVSYVSGADEYLADTRRVAWAIASLPGSQTMTLSFLGVVHYNDAQPVLQNIIAEMFTNNGSQLVATSNTMSIRVFPPLQTAYTLACSRASPIPEGTPYDVSLTFTNNDSVHALKQVMFMPVYDDKVMEPRAEVKPTTIPEIGGNGGAPATVVVTYGFVTPPGRLPSGTAVDVQPTFAFTVPGYYTQSELQRTLTRTLIPAPVIEITTTASTTALVNGETLTGTVAVRKVEPAQYDLPGGYTLTLPLHATALVFVSATAGGTLQSQRIVWTIPVLDSGTWSADFTVRAQDVTSTAITWPVAAELQGDLVPTTPTTPPVPQVTLFPLPQLGIEFTRSPSADTVAQGTLVQYTAKVLNTSTSTVARAINVTATLPPGLVYDPTSISGGATRDDTDPQLLRWTVTSLQSHNPSAGEQPRFASLKFGARASAGGGAVYVAEAAAVAEYLPAAVTASCTLTSTT